MPDLLIPDTNALLDIVRGRATGAGASPPLASTAQDAAAVCDLAPDVTIGLHPLVRMEYGRSIEAVRQHAFQEYQTTRRRLERLGINELPPAMLDADQLLNRDMGVVTRILGSAEEIMESQDDRAAADARFAERRPPAHKGQSATHDARILETALRLAADRPPNTTWFLSRNTTEFEERGALLPELAKEYRAAGLQHGRTWAAYLQRP